MAYRSSTTNSGASATPSVAVPAGVQIGDIVILTASIDVSAAVFQPADWPTGFTELQEADVTADGHSSAIGWKRLTAADAGTYTFGDLGASGDWICQAAAFSGRHATNPPVASAPNIQNTAQSSPVTVTATGVTAVDGDDLLWTSAPDVTSSGAGNGHTPPTNFTERQDAENLWSNLSIATRDNVGAGATGNISGTFNLSQDTAGWAVYLVRIPAAAGGPVLLELSGSITPAGALVKSISKPLSGAVTPAGALALSKTASRSFSGSITPSGALIKQAQKTLAGAVTPTGAIAKQTSKPLTGTVTPAGALSILKVILRVFTGLITPAGTLIKQITKTLAGSATPSGSILKSIGKTLSGLITPTGAVTTLKVILLTLAGSITPTGALVRQVTKSLGGSITPIGALGKTVSKLFSGVVTLAGQLINFVEGTPVPQTTVTVSNERLTVATVSNESLTTATVRNETVTIVTVSNELGG